MTCNQTQCLQCISSSATIKGNYCACPNDYYFKGDCIKCDTGCLACNSAGCLQCVINSNNINGKCICNNNRILINEECICTKGYVDIGTCVPCKNYSTNNDITGAYFNSDYLGISITFAINMVVEDLSCNDAINATSLKTLGELPACYWINSTYFFIELGNYPTITAGNLYLMPEHFQTINGTCYENPQILSPNISYKYPIPLPFLTIIGPDTVSLDCTEYITYQATSSGGFKNSIALSWTSSPFLPSVFNTNSMTLFISSLTVNALSISLTGINYLGISSTITYTTTIYLTDSYLSVIFNTGRNLTIYSNDYQMIQAIITNNCSQNSAKYWIWNYLGNSGNLQINGNLVLNKAINDTFEIFPNTFIPGYTYNFKLNVIEGTIQGEAYLDVTVLPLPPVLILSRSSGSISLYYDTNISASNSYDPNGNKIKYSWIIAGYPGILDTSSSYQLLLSKFIDILNPISISITISNDFLSVTESLLLIPIGANIQVNNTYNPQRMNLPIFYNTEINTPDNITLAWYSSNNDIISIYSGVIIPYTLECISYTLAISSKTSQYNILVSFNPNLSPMCDKIMIYPNNGAAITDVFNVSLFNCFDQDEKDYPLQIIYGLNNTNFNYTLTDLEFVRQRNLILMPGLFSVNAFVCDSMMLCIIYYTEILNISQIQDINTYSYYLSIRTNNPEDILSGIIAICSNGNASMELRDLMWQDIIKYTRNNLVSFYMILSAINALISYNISKIEEFVNYAGTIDIIPDDYAMDLIIQFASTSLNYSPTLQDLLIIDAFLLENLEKYTQNMLPETLFSTKSLELSLYKSRYTSTPIIPSSIYSFPSLIPELISNFRLITYNKPYSGISISFSTSGNFTNFNILPSPENMILMDNLNMTIELTIPPLINPVCLYLNSKGISSSNGCVILNNNQTSVIIQITHTSFFYITEQINPQNVLEGNNCDKNYAPLIISCVILLLGIILIMICYKIDVKYEDWLKRQINNFANNEDGENEHSKLNIDKYDSPSKTLTGPVVNDKDLKIYDFHIYFGLKSYSPVFLRSLKMFTIMCAYINELFFIGFFIITLEDFKENNANIYHWKYLGYAGIAIAINLPLQILQIICFSIKRILRGYYLALGVSEGVIMSTISIIYIASMNYEMCSCWAILWVYLFVYIFISEVFIIHVINMTVVYFYNKRRNAKIQTIS